MLRLPWMERRFTDEHGNGERRFAVGRDVEHILAAWSAVAFGGALAFVKILVYVSAFSRVRFLATHGGRAGEGSVFLSKPIEHCKVNYKGFIQAAVFLKGARRHKRDHR